MPRALSSAGSNANTVPLRRTTQNSADRPCGASKPPMVESANNCARPGLAWPSSLKKRRGVPKRIEIRDLSERAVVRLATERKHLTDIIKMVAYQAESDLLALLRPHYARADQEGRTLLHELFATAGDIRVCNRELRITLAPLSSPHRTHAAEALCQVLDQTATVFPGSSLRIRFSVRPPLCIGLAFPGSPAQRHTPTPPP